MQGCASFGGMDSITTAAQWLTQHPFLVLGVLVILAGALRAGASLHAGFRSRKARGLRLRTAKEQQRFDPVGTVYSPKGYRRQRR